MPNSYQVNIPTVGNTNIQFTANSNEVTFLLGPNGAGKSTLIYQLSPTHLNQVTRVSATRDISLDRSAPKLSGAQRSQYEGWIKSELRNANTRFHSGQNSNIKDTALFDIKEAGVHFDRTKLEAIKTTVDGSENEAKAVKNLRNNPSPMDRVIECMKAGGIIFGLEFNQTGELIATNQDGVSYGIHEMSDGERAALFLAIRIITAPQGQLILLDEPERHLHRSISSPLIHSLIQDRKDCAFLISTHDLRLVNDYPEASAVVMRSFKHPNIWDAVYIENIANLEPEIADVILGSRKKVLFVEGVTNSLDLSIYTALFQNVSVVAAQSSMNVIQNTRGINRTDGIHHVKAFGLIDNDRMTSEKIEKFNSDLIFPLNVNSVESLYYNLSIIKLVGENLKNTGLLDNIPEPEEINNLIVASYEEARDTLIADAKTRVTREILLGSCPSPREFKNNPNNFNFIDNDEIKNQIEKQEALFDELISARNAEALIANYKVKVTSIPATLSRRLNLSNRHSYETLVRNMIRDNAEMKQLALGLLGDLPAAINRN